MSTVNWQTWARPEIDSGREMHTPPRLLAGERLYCDVCYLYGPVAPYFNAAPYTVFGPHLNTLYAAGLIGFLLPVPMAFRLGRALMPTTEATLAAAAVTPPSFTPIVDIHLLDRKATILQFPKSGTSSISSYAICADRNPCNPDRLIGIIESVGVRYFRIAGCPGAGSRDTILDIHQLDRTAENVDVQDWVCYSAPSVSRPDQGMPS